MGFLSQGKMLLQSIHEDAKEDGRKQNEVVSYSWARTKEDRVNWLSLVYLIMYC